MIIISLENLINTSSSPKEVWLNENGEIKEEFRDTIKYIIDESSELGQKIMSFGMIIDIVEKDGELIDVTMREIPRDINRELKDAENQLWEILQQEEKIKRIDEAIYAGNQNIQTMNMPFDSSDSKNRKTELIDKILELREELGYV
jgi:hypothetical protein